MTIQKAREILGPKYEKRTDEEIQSILDTLKTLANITIDTVVQMSPEERKTLANEIKKA